jgi:myo-inositol-1(or 4)-monophosphatase
VIALKLLYKDFVEEVISVLVASFFENEDYHTLCFAKGEDDLVTNMDLEIEKEFTNLVKKHYPEHLVIGEEFAQNKLTDDWTWIIDPIDGTVNFASGSPLYGLQFSLYYQKEGIVSAIYLPATGDFLYAEKDAGAYHNGNRIILKDSDNLKKSIVSFGDFSHSNPSSREKQLYLLANLEDEVGKLRIYGSSAIDFGYVACGRSQAHVMFSKRIWEMSAGMLLIREAQGFTSKVGDAFIVASDPDLLQLIESLLENYD